MDRPVACGFLGTLRMIFSDDRWPVLVLAERPVGLVWPFAVGAYCQAVNDERYF